MVVVVSTLVARFLRNRCDEGFLGNLDELTVGLGKAAAVVMYVYFIMKVISVAHDSEWALLGTPYGSWFLVELLGFVLLPALLITFGFKKRSAAMVRAGSFMAVAGILLNRINVSIIAFNWNLPGHLQHIVPPWREVAVVLALSTVHVLVFRWIVNRMPVTREEPGYRAH